VFDRVCIDKWRRCWRLAFGERAVPVVDRESRMKTRDGCIRFSSRWEAIEIERSSRIVNALEQRLELLSLERHSLTAGLILDQHSMLLDVGNLKRLLRDRSKECGVCWKFLHVVEEIAPRHSKWHTGNSILRDKNMRACAIELTMINQQLTMINQQLTMINQQLTMINQQIATDGPVCWLMWAFCSYTGHAGVTGF
jgi:hypothetical protein